MSSRPNRLSWIVALLALLCCTGQALADDAFAGGWQVRCTPTAVTTNLGADAFDDGFLFEQGQFSAQAYAGLGFTPAAYTVDSVGRFTATLTSADRGTVIWKGRVGSGKISGWISWTKPDGAVYKYRFSGSAVVNDAPTGETVVSNGE